MLDSAASVEEPVPEELPAESRRLRLRGWSRTSSSMTCRPRNARFGNFDKRSYVHIADQLARRTTTAEAVQELTRRYSADLDALLHH